METDRELQDENFANADWGAAQLKEIAIFKEFSHEELVALYQSGKISRFRSKTHVVVEGEPTRGMYIILGGTVSVYKTDYASGNMIRLTMLEQGASFGEMSLFDHAPRSATVVAESRCYLFQLDADDFQGFLMEAGPELMVRFYRTCAEDLAEKFRVLNNDYLNSQKILWEHALRRSEPAS